MLLFRSVLLVTLIFFQVGHFAWAQKVIHINHDRVSSCKSGRSVQAYVLPAGSIVATNDKTATTVDWSGLFKTPIPQQESGSCHIYSATSWIEAVCKKELGLDVDLSEAYFYYRHLRKQLVDYGAIGLTDDALFSSIEGGTPDDIIQQFADNGDGCSKSEFTATEKTIINVFKGIKIQSIAQVDKNKENFIRDYKEQVKTEQFLTSSNDSIVKQLEKTRESYNLKVREKICNYVDGQIVCLDPRLKQLTPDPLVGYKIETAAQGVLQCAADLKGRATTVADPTTDQITEALDAGCPVICAGSFIFMPESGFNSKAFYDEGLHATILYGYRKSASGLVEFLVRDSNFKNLNQFTVTGCDRITEITPKESSQ